MSLVDKMSPEQKQCYDKILARENVALLGPAGCGKSFVIGQAVLALERMGLQVARTSFVGVAALNIGGTTVNSFANI